MEDRKKILRDLEAKKAEIHEVLNKLLENLGNSLMTSLESGGKFFPDLPEPSSDDPNPRSIWDEKLKLNNEIADTEDTIKAIEADLSRLGYIEAEISRKESENIEKTKEFSQASTDVGRLILEESAFDEFTASFRQQLEDIFLQIDTQEKRLNELENTEGGFFARLANGARGWLTKSQLSKHEATLKELYRNAGEQFILSREDAKVKESPPEMDDSSFSEEIYNQIRKTEEIRKFQVSLNDEVSKLLTERREIADTLNREGNPVKRISGLENFISRNREEIRMVHRYFGFSIREKEWKDKFISLYSEEDKALGEKINSLEESLKETEDRLEAIKTAIAIDNEKAEIEKMRGVIEEKRKQLAEVETAIAEIEEQINAAEKRIEELS